MTTTEKNQYLADYMGWEKSTFRFDGKKLPRYRVPNVFGEDRGTTDFAPEAMQFDKDWNWFQQPFQKALKEDRLDHDQINDILGYFKSNQIEFACDILIGFLKRNS